jgi:hypothetical protein
MYKGIGFADDVFLMSSPAQTLGSWDRIPLEAWAYIPVSYVLV